MPTLAAARAANAATRITSTPTALFVGGTSGIGQGAAESFAQYTEGNARIILCGRNESAAKEIIASFPQHPSSSYEFLQCDVSSLRNVSAACKILKEERGLSKLNYLFMSPGLLSTAEFTDNGEGLDKKMAIHFYARWKFFAELGPQMQAAKDAGEEARVVTVAAAGHGGPVDLTDLGLKNHYTLARAGSQSPTYNSMLVEEFAKKYPQLSFTHIHPGIVKTPLYNASMAMKVVGFLVTPIAVSATDCSEWMLRPGLTLQ